MEVFGRSGVHFKAGTITPLGWRGMMTAQRMVSSSRTGRSIDMISDAHIVAMPDGPTYAIMVVGGTKARGSRAAVNKFTKVAAKKGRSYE